MTAGDDDGVSNAVSASRLAHTITEDVRMRTRSLVRTVSEDSEALEYGRREMAKTLTLSSSTEETLKVAYRSTGLGLYAIVMRAAGMPLERLAMVLNSSQVHGSGQFSQAAKIVFAGGPLAPFRNVGRASVVAWFLQYSVMGCVFQVCDRALSKALGLNPMPYGEELMRPSGESSSSHPLEQAKTAAKIVLAPMLAGAIESSVSNRAEAQRFYGFAKLASVERSLNANAVARALGPGFAANASRNFIMASSSFVVTPLLYKHYFPQERKDARSLFWFGLGVNIFGGNMLAITQQSLWGRSLDYCSAGGGRPISYSAVIRQGVAAEGAAAFITPTKWFARVLMNAPVQGTLPWFFNEILPLGEPAVLDGARGLALALKGSLGPSH